MTNALVKSLKWHQVTKLRPQMWSTLSTIPQAIKNAEPDNVHWPQPECPTSATLEEQSMVFTMILWSSQSLFRPLGFALDILTSRLKFVANKVYHVFHTIDLNLKRTQLLVPLCLCHVYTHIAPPPRSIIVGQLETLS